MVTHFRTTSSELGLRSLTLTTEDNRSAKLFPVSLEGIPPSVIGCLRRMRLSQTVTVTHNELLLQPDTQIAAGQGQAFFQAASSSHISSREGMLKTGGKLHAWGALSDAAAELEQRKERAMFALEPSLHGGASDEDGDGDSEDEDGFGFKVSSPRSERKVVADPTMANSLGSFTTSAASVVKKKKQQPKALSVKSKDDEDDDKDDGQSLDMGGLAKTDPDMARVAAKHAQLSGHESSCFGNLAVARFLRNERLGKAVQGDAWLSLSHANP